MKYTLALGQSQWFPVVRNFKMSEHTLLHHFMNIVESKFSVSTKNLVKSMDLESDVGVNLTLLQ